MTQDQQQEPKGAPKAQETAKAVAPAPSQAKARADDATAPQAAQEARQAEAVKVVYRGPSGRFRDGDKTLEQHGSPVEMRRERLEELRARFGNHRFEEAD